MRPAFLLSLATLLFSATVTDAKPNDDLIFLPQFEPNEITITSTQFPFAPIQYKPPFEPKINFVMILQEDGTIKIVPDGGTPESRADAVVPSLPGSKPADPLSLMLNAASLHPDIVFPFGPTTDIQLVETLYPKSKALDMVIENHKGLPFYVKSAMVLATTFPEGNPNVAYYYWIDNTGTVEHCHDLYNWAVQGGGSWQLNGEALADVRRSLSNPPPSNAPKQLKDLVIVTYIHGNQRTTCLYDKSDSSAVLRYLSITPVVKRVNK